MRLTVLMWLGLVLHGSVFAVAAAPEAVRGTLRNLRLKSGAMLMVQPDFRSDLVCFHLALRTPAMNSKVVPGAMELLLRYLQSRDPLITSPFHPTGIKVFGLTRSISPSQADLFGQFLGMDGLDPLTSVLDLHFFPKWDEKRFLEIREKFVEELETRGENLSGFGQIQDKSILDWVGSGSVDSVRAPIAEIGSLTMNQIRELHALAFVPLNLSLAVVGAVKLKPLVAAAESQIQKLQNIKPATPVISLKRPTEPIREFIGVNQAYGSLSFIGPKLDSEEMILFRQIPHILQVGHGGVFQSMLGKDERIVDTDVSVLDVGEYAWLQIQFRGFNILPMEIAERLNEAIRIFANRRVSAQDLQRIRDRSRNAMFQKMASPYEMAYLYAAMGLHNYPFLAVGEYRHLLDTMSAEQIQSTFRKYITPELSHVRSIEPVSNQGIKTAVHAERNWRNARIHVESDSIQDMIGLGFVFTLSPHENPAVSTLAAMMLHAVSNKFADPSVQDRFVELGLRVTPIEMRGYHAAFTSLHPSQLSAVMSLLPHWLFGRRFTPSDLDAAREIWYSRNKMTKADASASQHFYRSVLPDLPELSTDLIPEAKIKDVTFAEVETYIAQSLTPQSLDIAITGDLHPDNLIRQFEQATEAFFEANPKHSLAFAPIVARGSNLTVRLPTQKIDRQELTDEAIFRITQADIYTPTELTMKEQAAMILIALRFFREVMPNQNGDPAKPEGVKTVSISFTSIPFPVFICQVTGEPKALQEGEAYLKRALEQAANFADSSQEFAAFKRLILFGKAAETMDRGLRALNRALFSAFAADPETADKLVEAIQELTPNDLKSALYDRILGKIRLVQKPKK